MPSVAQNLVPKVWFFGFFGTTKICFFVFGAFWFELGERNANMEAEGCSASANYVQAQNVENTKRFGTYF